MNIEYIRYELTTHEPNELIEAYSEAGPLLQASPECLAYDLAQQSEDRKTFVLRINWASVEEHMNGFRNGENFPRFLSLVRPFISEIVEMKHYDQTNVTWAR